MADESGPDSYRHGKQIVTVSFVIIMALVWYLMMQMIAALMSGYVPREIPYINLRLSYQLVFQALMTIGLILGVMITTIPGGGGDSGRE